MRTNRGSNKFGFIELNDGTFFKSLQVVYEAEQLDNYEEISKAPISAALCVEGTFVLTPDAQQPFELKAKSVSVEADSDADYPLQKKRHSLEYLREIAHLRRLTRMGLNISATSRFRLKRLKLVSCRYPIRGSRCVRYICERAKR